MKTWKDFWGNDAEYDLAPDLEEFYEEKFGKSSVLWTPDIERFEAPTDDLPTRPEFYSTHGYTGDFEHWGITVCTEAAAQGLTNADEVYTYITGKQF